MANYKLVFKKSVAKDLRSIPHQKDVQRILIRIEQLAKEPRPASCEKLTNSEKCRIRQGNYRILYTIEDEIITITIIKVGHRRNVYQ